MRRMAATIGRRESQRGWGIFARRHPRMPVYQTEGPWVCGLLETCWTDESVLYQCPSIANLLGLMHVALRKALQG